MKAAVYYRPNEPLALEEVELLAPQRNEVTVRMAASGVCHSDLHFIDGLLPHPARPCWGTKEPAWWKSWARASPTSRAATT